MKNSTEKYGKELIQAVINSDTEYSYFAKILLDEPNGVFELSEQIYIDFTADENYPKSVLGSPVVDALMYYHFLNSYNKN